DVAGDRRATPPARRRNAPGAVGKLLAFDHPAHRLAEPLAVPSRLTRDLVDPPGIAPHTELAASDVSTHVLAGAALPGQLEIVDDPRPVRGHVRDHSLFDQCDDTIR